MYPHVNIPAYKNREPFSRRDRHNHLSNKLVHNTDTMKRTGSVAFKRNNAMQGTAVLSLNVGGRRFQMSRETASRIPYFQPLLEGRFTFACDDTGCIFVDRSAELFKHLLQFARDARRPSKNILDAHKEALLAECDFFALDHLAHHLREETSPYDLRLEDRQTRETELRVRAGEIQEGALLDFFTQDHSPLEREGLQLHLLFQSEPRTVVTGNYKIFYERLNTFSGGILPDLSTIPDILIAGGAVVGALTNTPSSDLDIFLVCDPAEAESRLRDIYMIVQKNLRARCGDEGQILITRSATAVTFHHCFKGKAVKGTPVQVVIGLGRSAADVLCRFDVDCCCVAFIPNEGRTVCSRRGLRAMRYGVNVVDSAFGGPSYAKRLQKYAERRWAAAVP